MHAAVQVPVTSPCKKIQADINGILTDDCLTSGLVPLIFPERCMFTRKRLFFFITILIRQIVSRVSTGTMRLVST